MNITIIQEYQDSLRITTIEGKETASDSSRFSVMPTWVMESRILTPNEKLIYSLLHTFNTNAKSFYGSNDFIARSVGLTESGVQSVLNKLEGRGLIKRHYEEGQPIKGRKSIETFEPIYDGRQTYLRSSIGLSMPVDTPLSMPVDHTNIDNTNKVTNDHFQKFWEQYPRKIGKEKSRKLFTSLIRKQKIPATSILDGLSRANSSWSRDKTELRFIPHPATWLADGRWEDDFAPQKAPAFRKLN